LFAIVLVVLTSQDNILTPLSILALAACIRNTGLQNVDIGALAGSDATTMGFDGSYVSPDALDANSAMAQEQMQVAIKELADNLFRNRMQRELQINARMGMYAHPLLFIFCFKNCSLMIVSLIVCH
jgi:hypothetical protein